MTEQIKIDSIESLVTIAYYWIGERNPQCAYSIIKLLEKLELSKKSAKRLDDLTSDFKTFFNGINHTFDYDTFEEIDIPNNINSEEEKLLWISGITILNLISSGNFELGYTMLMDMSINWKELYIYVVNSLKKQPFVNMFSEWLITHFFMAYDLLGEKEMSMLGYKIIKTEDIN